MSSPFVSSIVIINHRYEFVYHHTPKTGGSFISQMLLRHCPDSIDITPENLSHYTDDEVGDIDVPGAKHFPFHRLSQDIKDNYTLLVSVRHPFQLWVSWYIEVCHNSKIEGIEPYREDTAQTFEDFMNEWTHNFNGLRSQSFIMQTNINNCHIYDTLHHESLACDIAQLFNSLGLTVPPELFTTRVRQSNPDFRREVIRDIFETAPNLYNKIMYYEYYIAGKFYGR